MGGYLPPTSRNGPREPALGCTACFLFASCGGIYDGVFDCLAYCCGKPEKCSYVCPRSRRFAEVVRDTGGLSLRGPWYAAQQSSALPEYIPCIQHGSKRDQPLDIPLAVLPTCEVTRRKKKSGDMFAGPSELRKAFKLSDCRIILSSVDEDDAIENLWRVKSARRIAEKLAQLDVEHIIAPNFSLPREIPRFDNIANIRRSLICMQELSHAGMSVIPYLAAVTEHDWNYWLGFLRDHADIKIVAKELQTGGANTQVAEWHLRQLLNLQDRLGRGLHVVVIGGGYRHVRLLAGFEAVTVVNSDPFMKTQFRLRLTESGRWEAAPTAIGEPLDFLLCENIAQYERMIHQRLRVEREGAKEVKTAAVSFSPPRNAPAELPGIATVLPESSTLFATA